MSRQPRDQLQPDEITWTEDASQQALPQTEPLRTDYGNQHPASAQPLGNDVNEIDTRFNPIDIHEDIVASKSRLQEIGEPSGRHLAVGAPVVDENRGRAGTAFISWND
jgi:hypothetical protein